MSEWFKEHAWKACRVARLSQVRILFSPPEQEDNPQGCIFVLLEQDESPRFVQCPAACGNGALFISCSLRQNKKGDPMGLIFCRLFFVNVDVTARVERDGFVDGGFCDFAGL